MFKNTLKRLGAIVMVLALAMSVMMVSAFATNNPTTVTITKTLTKSADAPVPNTSFSFNIEAGAAGVYQQEGMADIAITPGTAMGTVTTSGDPVVSADGTTVTYTATITLPEYEAAGIYSYKVSEVDGGYAGINYDNTVYNMNVFVDNTNSVYAVTVNGKGLGTGTDKASLDFNNSYETKSLTVEKQIEGNMADLNATFEINTKIEGVPGKSYTVKHGNVTSTVTADNTTGIANVAISLGDDDTYTIYGLTDADTYTVSESDTVAGEYTVSYEGVTTGKASNNKVTVTNTKNASTPTGVIMNIAPYVLMVALAGGIAFFFLRRRNAE